MSLPIIDLRSDISSKPTPEMRQAMFESDVGHELLGEDAKTIELEEIAAKLLDKEAALFVPTGAMGNLISILVHCYEFGCEIIVGDQCHIHLFAQGGCSTIGRVHCRAVRTQSDGTLLLQDIEDYIRPANESVLIPRTKLVCLENTHTQTGGKVLSVEYTESVGQLCQQYGLKLHMDGTRLLNAAVYLNVEPAKLVRACDSITLCLSKSLAAPIGSLVVGSRDFIEKARRMRKVLGGAVKHAGMLAAAGIIALTQMSKRLHIDHENAKILAEGLANIDGFILNSEDTQTNIVFITIDFNKFQINEETLRNLLKDQYGIILPISAKSKFRLVTHYMITKQHIEYVVETLAKVSNQFRNN